MDRQGAFRQTPGMDGKSERPNPQRPARKTILRRSNRGLSTLQKESIAVVG
jgi:hypothetical protein